MKHFIFLFLSSSLFSITNAQTLRSIWSENLGGTDLDIIYDFTLNDQGEVFGVGTVLGDVGALDSYGGEDCYLFQLDSNGQKTNEYLFGGVSFDGGKGIAVDDNNNIWASGYFRQTLYFNNDSIIGNNGNDAFLLKINQSGQLEQNFSISSQGFDTGEKVAYKNGYIYWLGTFQDTIIYNQDTLIDQGLGDAFLIKMDTLGNTIWTRNWGYLSGDVPIDLGVDEFENVTIITNFRDGVIVENDTILGNGASDILVHQYNVAGQLNWANTWGGIDDDLATSITVSESGDIYFTGAFVNDTQLGNNSYTSWGEEDIFVVALNASGNTNWTKHIYGYDKLVGEDITWSPQRQELYLLGLLQGALYLSPNDSIESTGINRHVADDIALVTLDKNGQILYGESIGAFKEDYAVGIEANNSTDKIHITGNFLDTTDILGQDLYGNGSLDIFVAQLGFQLPANITNSSISTTAIYLYPNPFDDQAILEFDLDQKTNSSYYQIYTIDGKLVDERYLGSLNTGNHQLPIHRKDLIPNLYTLTLYLDKDIQTIVISVK